MDQLTRKVYNILQTNNFYHAYINKVIRKDSVIHIFIQLPNHKHEQDLDELVLILKEQLQANDYKMKTKGNQVHIQLGMEALDSIQFKPWMINHNTLKLTLVSSFGNTYIDFSDGASCHMLNGGTTRMGKTSFLLYLSTMMFIQQKGQCKIIITSTKTKDYYPFIDVMNASLSKTPSQLMITLDQLIQEYQHRDELLNNQKLRYATDAKDVQKFYPEHYHNFKPIFLIIDEYARFSDNKEIQKKVQELVESAGYVNIHVIISSQRPDAKNVLNARIKANLLARICFTTADENNSMIILDRKGAERLGKIQGRAILLDTDYNIIQVPYITPDQCETLLNEYRKEEQHEQKTKGSTHTEPPHEIQNSIQESTSEDDFFQQFQSSERMQQSNETPVNGWFRLASATDKRPTVSVHPEPIADPSQIKQD